MVETIARPSREEVRQQLDLHYRPEAFGVLQAQVRGANRRAAVCGGFAAVAFLAALFFAAQPKLIPYPIVYDPDGHLIWHGQAATTREERFIDVALIEWVWTMRTVPSDEVMFHGLRDEAGAMVYGKAAKDFAAYNKDTIAAYKDPQRRVFVTIKKQGMTIRRQGVSHVIIGWTETWTPEFGYGAETHRFEAAIDYAWYAKPAGFTAAKARLNPRRLYVTEYVWDEIRQEAR
jgi:type IV secretory pathway TrbF-like protein